LHFVPLFYYVLTRVIQRKTFRSVQSPQQATNVRSLRVRKIWHAFCFSHYMFLGSQKNRTDWEKSIKEAKGRNGL
jgi:hypothetical protein